MYILIYKAIFRKAIHSKLRFEKQMLELTYLKWTRYLNRL